MEVEQQIVVLEKRGRGRPKKYPNDEERLEAKREQFRLASQRYYEKHREEKLAAVHDYYNLKKDHLQTYGRNYYHLNKSVAT
jgi:hypothetical protein